MAWGRRELPARPALPGPPPREPQAESHPVDGYAMSRSTLLVTSPSQPMFPLVSSCDAVAMFRRVASWSGKKKKKKRLHGLKHPLTNIHPWPEPALLSGSLHHDMSKSSRF